MPPATCSTSPRGQRLVEGNRLQLLGGMKEQIAQQANRTGCRRHRPKRASTLSDRNVERVHVGSCTGFPHDRGGAPDMIRVAVREDQLLELVKRTAESADGPEERCLLTRETRVDQCQPSSPSIRKAFAIPIRTMYTPLITRFMAISETGWYNPSMDDWRRWAYRPLLHSPLIIPESAARELESL
jgi:hypothetical protein